MPRPSQRTKKVRRIKRRLPGGRTVIRFEKKDHSKPVCSVCKKPLAGVKSGRTAELKKLPKSKKRPNRPYGGQLCSRCMREKIKEKYIRSG